MSIVAITFGRVLAVSVISDIREIVILSSEDEVIRAILSPHHQTKGIFLNSNVELRNFLVVNDNEHLQSTDVSQVTSEYIPNLKVPEIFPHIERVWGAFMVEPLMSIEQRSREEKPSFGYIRGFINFIELPLNFCVTRSQVSVKLVLNLDVDGHMTKITLTNESLSSLLGCQFPECLLEEDGLINLLVLFGYPSDTPIIVPEELGLRIMAKKVFSDGIMTMEYIAQPPMFSFGAQYGLFH